MPFSTLFLKVYFDVQFFKGKYNTIIKRNIGIPTVPLALAPTPAKPAKITPAIYRAAACKAKRCKSAKARTTAGYNAGRYTTNSGLTADKDDNNAYNGAYMPPTDAKEEEEKKGSSSDDNGINGGTSNSTDKGKGSSTRKRSKGALRYKDTLLYKRQRITSHPYGPPGTPYADIYIYYV
ncbi:hypothetical protein P8C59_001639 [Phyllachora maydis]|uniref:Uncharacterized protein n=1 Tax=Phyllachora maydis TaxID=1825666 RepID=A0AAD9HZZ4_9PEZI|nr:hypothetical protein P8C59_001639 [Phyllachora maydis]